MTIVKKFSSRAKLEEYLNSNGQYHVLNRIGVDGSIVLLSDDSEPVNKDSVKSVDRYISEEHYEDVNLHYEAYYGEY
tara:strand:+ start:1459 stop:1689 length:231 start_codon:yes stop_codon:yes gene_type:complete